MKAKQITITLIILGMVILSMGCGAKKLYLTYAPASPKASPKKTDIAVTIFEDSRGNNTISEVSYLVLAEGHDVGAWVANALANELINCGYQVSKITETMPEAHDIFISGSVKNAFIRKKMFGPVAIIEVTVTVFKKGLPVLDDTFRAECRCHMFWGSASENAAALEEVLHEAMTQILPQVEEAIR